MRILTIQKNKSHANNPTDSTNTKQSNSGLDKQEPPVVISKDAQVESEGVTAAEDEKGKGYYQDDEGDVFYDTKIEVEEEFFDAMETFSLKVQHEDNVDIEQKDTLIVNQNDAETNSMANDGHSIVEDSDSGYDSNCDNIEEKPLTLPEVSTSFFKNDGEFQQCLWFVQAKTEEGEDLGWLKKIVINTYTNETVRHTISKLQEFCNCFHKYQETSNQKNYFD